MRFQAASCSRKLPVFGLMLSSALMLFLQLPVHARQDVTLAWNPSSTPDVAGYKIYYGTACGCYSNVVAVGNTTNATVSGLIPGRKYYFAATTVDGAGNESGFSNEASYAVPVTAATLAPRPVPPGNSVSWSPGTPASSMSSRRPPICSTGFCFKRTPHRSGSRTVTPPGSISDSTAPFICHLES